MTFVAGPLNKELLFNHTHANTPACSEVIAAIAYANSDNLHLFEACKTHGKNLTFYGRYDKTVPIQPAVVKWFLDKASPSFVCRMVPDILHAKVIWWRDVGAYIGSANLTDRAWNSNIEAGTYLSQDELESLDLITELQRFFDVVELNSQPISDELYRHLLSLVDMRKAIYRAEQEFEKRANRFYAEGKGLIDVSSAPAVEKAYSNFERSWRESLQVLRDISKVVVLDEFRPSWIPSSVPVGAQADQFIHAYYYRFVQGHRGNQYVEEFHLKNQASPQLALQEALNWWKRSEFDYSDEKKHLLDWAPRLQDALSQTSLRKMDKDTFIETLSKVHAVRDYAGKQSNTDLGLTTPSYEEKLAAHLSQIWDLRSKDGKTILDLLDYVIWGTGQIEKRIWDGVKSTRWAIPKIGYSTLGEIVGWARPNEYPPRNDRSIKGLRALGQRVRGV
jgi:hypothetical protein